MRVLDLFSGIGGFSLGLERTGGFRTVAFCEIDPYCRAVLRKHWPDVPIWGDVRTLTRGCMYELAGVDLICGGFPCQDISTAGKGAGIDGERSGLWHEFARIIGEVRPRCVIVENVSALLGRGLGRVLGNLAALGYDAEWHCIPASYVGAPHRRDRVWIIAYAQREQLRQQSGRCGGPSRAGAAQPAIDGEERNVAHADEQSMGRIAIARRECNQWLAEPNVGRVANGVPSRAYRLRVLGNAVVPQVVEIIGRAIIEAEERCASPLG